MMWKQQEKYHKFLFKTNKGHFCQELNSIEKQSPASICQIEDKILTLTNKKFYSNHGILLDWYCLVCKELQ